MEQVTLQLEALDRAIAQRQEAEMKLLQRTIEEATQQDFKKELERQLEQSIERMASLQRDEHDRVKQLLSSAQKQNNKVSSDLLGRHQQALDKGLQSLRASVDSKFAAIMSKLSNQGWF